MNVSLLQYSHILIFNVVDEPDITMTLLRAKDPDILNGKVEQVGFLYWEFNYTGNIRIPVLIEALKMYNTQRVPVPESNCNHDYDFAPEYHGNCPQPRRCAKCGALDLNGYRGMIK